MTIAHITRPDNKSRVKILYIESGLAGGGSAESLYQHLKVLDRTKYEPIVVFLNQNRYFEGISGIDVRCLVFFDWLYNKEFNEAHPELIKWLLRFKHRISKHISFLSVIVEHLLHFSVIKELKQLMLKENIDLIHTNNQVHRDFYAILAARSKDIPCVSHIRSVNTEGFDKKKAELVNNNVERIITYSHGVAEYWINKGINSKKINIVHNSIGPMNINGINLHKEFGFNDSFATIGIVGRIIPVRNHMMLINAFCKLLAKCPETQLLIIGEGLPKFVEPLVERVNVLGISRNVTFTGYYPQARKIIASLDVLVLPYTIEPFGRTLLEAWKLKTPVVLSKVGYIGKIVQDTVNALLFDIDSEEQLINSLEKILKNSQLRDKLIESGFQWCQKEFSMDVYSEKIEEIYDDILKDKGFSFKDTKTSIEIVHNISVTTSPGG